MANTTNFDIRIFHPFRDPQTIKVNDLDNTNTINKNSEKKGFYSIDSYKWNNSQYVNRQQVIDKGNDSVVEEVFTQYRQPIFLEVTEFQPILVLGWLREVNKYYQGAVAAADTFGEASSSLGSLLAAIAKGEADPKKFIDYLSLESESLGKNPEKVLGVPIDLIKGMFQGSYVAKYEVPYKSSKIYKADGRAGWDSKNSSKDSAGVVGELWKITQKQVPVDFPMIPEWKYDGGISSPEIETSFLLYNDSYENLVRNFKFMHAFIAGAFWEQIDYIQRPPNVYNICFPGYFEYFYCTAEIEVETVGNMRRVHRDSNINSDLGISANADFSKTFFPDAYKITVKFNSMVPNNFNLYLRYLLSGKSTGVEVGETQAFTLTQSNIFKGITTVANTPGKIVNGVYQGIVNK